MSRCTAFAPTDFTYSDYDSPTALFQFVYSAAREVCSDAFSDGANEYPGGTGTALFRTARGRWVWAHYSLWQGTAPVTYTAATDLDGTPFDLGAVDSFIGRYGDDDDLTLWRADIESPLPLA